MKQPTVVGQGDKGGNRGSLLVVGINAGIVGHSGLGMTKGGRHYGLWGILELLLAYEFINRRHGLTGGRQRVRELKIRVEVLILEVKH